MRRASFWPVAAVVAVLVATVGMTMLRPSSAASLTPLAVGGHSFHLEVAETQAAQELGLGGRQSLASDQGMLFRYPNERKLCFWMKDMHFPIDMIWVGSDKTVKHVEANVSPQTYPKSYCGAGLAQYVIELPPNAAAQSGVKTGSQLQF